MHVHLFAFSASHILRFRVAALAIQENDLTGTLEPLCDVRDDVLIDNEADVYLEFLSADCNGDPPEVTCSCCECFPKDE